MKKRSYIKGGFGGKANGLNLYIQKNEKLTKNDRKKLLRVSENYISEVNGFLPLSQHFNHLDNELTDYENLERWNDFFLNYGHFFNDLRGSWERIYLKDSDKFLQ